MSYLVFCTFDLKSASSQDYQNAYADLAKIGLHKVAKASTGEHVVIPTTSVMGEFNSPGASQAANHVRDKVKSAFAARKFKSEIFVIAGGDWAWTGATT
ncbi:MAG: hypothetical protein AB7E32_14795 [Desulfovibrio sp.]